MNHIEAVRPDKNSETAVLGGHQGHGVALIMDELGGGKMACAANFRGMNDGRLDSGNGFGHHDLFGGGANGGPGHFGSEGEKGMVPGENGGSIYCRKSANNIDGSDKDRKSTSLNSSHICASSMTSSA